MILINIGAPAKYTKESIILLIKETIKRTDASASVEINFIGQNEDSNIFELKATDPKVFYIAGNAIGVLRADISKTKIEFSLN